MSTLLIDVGNTRLKWALLDGLLPGPQRAVAHRGAPSMQRIVRGIRASLRAAALQPQHALVVSVAGAQVDAALRLAFRQQFALRLQFVRTTAQAAGVRNGYREVWRLGADRWVGLLGARALLPQRAVCVVDIGTALTIDLLDAAGVHRGGAIVPGPALMVDSLLRDTRGIRRRAAQARGIDNSAVTARAAGLFARHTRAAIDAGARYAVAAVVDRACREARQQLHSAPRLVLSGGAAPAIAPLLRTRARLVPDLVLRGLAVLALSRQR